MASSITPEQRKLFFLIAILAAAAGSYMEVMRHEKLKEQRATPPAAAPEGAPSGSAPANPAH